MNFRQPQRQSSASAQNRPINVSRKNRNNSGGLASLASERSSSSEPSPPAVVDGKPTINHKSSEGLASFSSEIPAPSESDYKMVDSTNNNNDQKRKTAIASEYNEPSSQVMNRKPTSHHSGGGIASLSSEVQAPELSHSYKMVVATTTTTTSNDQNQPSTKRRSKSHGSNCSDPPITNYESSDNDDIDSTTSDVSQHRARRRQLREIAAQSDDCWDTQLSDDEVSSSLPMEWNASMVRRKMMRQSINSRKQKDSSGNYEVGGGGKNESRNSNNIHMHYTRNPSNSKQNVPNKAEPEEMMSPPEQLLQKRLERKQRLHDKHEQFVRYQQYQKSHEQNNETDGRKQQHFPITPTTNKPSINLLTGRNNSETSTASPLFPDEEYEDDNMSTVVSSNGASRDYNMQRSPAPKKPSSQQQNDPTKMSPAEAASSPLHSLPQRPVCPFPDEADRKRIVGCLAAVLASSYAYETAPHLLIQKKKLGKGMPIEESLGKETNDFPAVQEVSVPTTGGIEVDMEGNLSESFETCDDTTTYFDESTHGRGGENRSKKSNADFDSSAAHSHLQPHTKQQHLIQQRQQQPRPRPPTPFNSFMAALQESKGPSFQNHKSHSMSEAPPISPRKSPTPSNPMASLQQSFSFASFNNTSSASEAARKLFDKPGSQNPPASLTVELAEIRHRIRRHAILSELLVSSAEMLMLDPSHAKAFLPMLETLLTKVEVPNNGTANVNNEYGPMDRSGHSVNSIGRQSWKGRGFGGGGVPHSDFNEKKTVSSSSSSQLPTSPTAQSISQAKQQKEGSTSMQSPPPTHDRSSNVNNSNNNNNNTASQVSSNVDKQNTGELHETSSSSKPRSMGAEKQPSRSTNPTTPPYAPLDTAIVEKDLVDPFLQSLTPGAGFRCIALLLLNHLLRDGRGYDARVRQAFKRLAVIVLSHELKVGGILRVDMDDEEDLDALLWGDGKIQQPNSSNEEEAFDDVDELALLATRKFEAMEHAIAAKLIAMSGNAKQKQPSGNRNRASSQANDPRRNNPQKQPSQPKKSESSASSPSSSTHGRIALAPKETPLSSQHGISKEQLLRGIKVTTAGELVMCVVCFHSTKMKNHTFCFGKILLKLYNAQPKHTSLQLVLCKRQGAVGATLFALTGGLAAPGIAAGLAAVGEYTNQIKTSDNPPLYRHHSSFL